VATNLAANQEELSTMPKKKSSTQTVETPVSKTKFVLDLPATTPADEVVAKAADAGLAISKAYVYTIRANSKRAGKAKRRARGSSGSKGSSTPKAAAPKKGSLDIQFASFIAEIGLTRAEELMKSVRAKFRSSTS
jgi:hypothetical protein